MNSQDEIGQLAAAANSMITNLRNLVRNVLLNAQQVVASSEELTASADQASQASNQVAGAVTEVARATEKQLDSVNDASKVVERMSSRLRQVATDVNECSRGNGQVGGIGASGSKVSSNHDESDEENRSKCQCFGASCCQLRQ